jgi:hypothetical protein
MQRHLPVPMAFRPNCLHLALAGRVLRQPDENAANEPITDEYERFRIQVLHVCLDTVIVQLSDRFAADKFSIFVQMQSFAPWKLMTDEYVNSETIKELCEFYGLDPVLVARELVSHTEVFIPNNTGFSEPNAIVIKAQHFHAEQTGNQP